MKTLTKYLAIAFFCGTSAVQAQTKKKPNIIFILADDLGYGNVQSFNPRSKIPTPNIDQLGNEGIKFTRFYAGSTVCAPSRCSLITGLSTGHSFIRGNAKAKDGLAALRAQDFSVAQVMQQNGYKTGMFGKWGLGDQDSQGAPNLKGFDRFYGYLDQSHAHKYHTPYLYEIVQNKTVKVTIDSTAFTDDLIMDKAKQFISQNKDNPFFLYLPLTLPHAELKVPEVYMKRFQNEDGSSKFPPEKAFQKRGNYDYQEQPHAAFAGMVSKLDDNVGAILALVKQLGLDKDTYIFFTSDNGPHQEGGADPEYFNSSGAFRGIKRDLYEGGIRVPMVVRAPGNIPAGQVNGTAWAFWDLMPTFCALANIKGPETIDGLSFAASLKGGKAPKEHPYLYWQFNEGNFKEAITQGDWKLIRFKSADKPEVYELYNLTNDRAERTNLASKEGKKFKELIALMHQAKTPAENKLFDWSALAN
ncbi:arylsulfatase [Pedobacter sp. MW01-1-1]|uniref:arylsulfatase n=1 Tax=Pedobacter sp. MW01-1-1 TaxID=3383027 RepID=UPI003FEF66A6